jgi:glycosyltransferase involved in cell wall biosynthesis
VAKQGLEGRVKFIGFVADGDLPALYSDSALMVFPSLYEGFGLPLLEAMACGVPVLSSDSSCLPEVAGDAAVLLSPTDQGAWTQTMMELLNNPGQRGRMVAAGFLQARQFTWKQAAEELLEIYQGLVHIGKIM